MLRLKTIGVALVGFLVVSFLSAGGALAFVRTDVTLTGSDITNTSVGGLGIPVTTYSDSGTTPMDLYSTTSGGSVTADTTRGEQEGSIFGGIEDFAAPSPRTSGFAGFVLDQQDRFAIRAGTSGLASGAPVKVRIQVRANGNVTIGGNPSGTSSLGFSVSGVPGVVGSWIDWTTGSLNPPVDLDISESWEIEADTTIDAEFQLRTRSSASLNDTAYEGNGTNTLEFAVIARVSPGVGCDGCVIESEAGAPTTPLAAVPALPPLGVGLLVIAVIGVGVVAARRRPARLAGQ